MATTRTRGFGVSHWRERPSSLAFCGHVAAVHQVPHNCNVVERVGKHASCQHQLQIPMNQATMQVFLWTASLGSQLCHVCSRLELACSGGDVVGECWQLCFVSRWRISGGARCTLKVIFRPAGFLHVAVQCRFVSLVPLLWRFCFFPGIQEVLQITVSSVFQALFSFFACSL